MYLIEFKCDVIFVSLFLLRFFNLLKVEFARRSHLNPHLILIFLFDSLDYELDRLIQPENLRTEANSHLVRPLIHGSCLPHVEDNVGVSVRGGSPFGDCTNYETGRLRIAENSHHIDRNVRILQVLEHPPLPIPLALTLLPHKGGELLVRRTPPIRLLMVDYAVLGVAPFDKLLTVQGAIIVPPQLVVVSERQGQHKNVHSKGVISGRELDIGVEVTHLLDGRLVVLLEVLGLGVTFGTDR